MGRGLCEPFLQRWLEALKNDLSVHVPTSQTADSIYSDDLSRVLLMGKCYGETALSSPGADSKFAVSGLWL